MSFNRKTSNFYWLTIVLSIWKPRDTCQRDQKFCNFPATAFPRCNKNPELERSRWTRIKSQVSLRALSSFNRGMSLTNLIILRRETYSVFGSTTRENDAYFCYCTVKPRTPTRPGQKKFHWPSDSTKSYQTNFTWKNIFPNLLHGSVSAEFQLY